MPETAARSARSDRLAPGRPYRSWVLACAAAEAVGMTAAATAARLADGWSGPAALAAVVAGGLVEGVALGVAQSTVLGRVLPALSRRRYAAATVLVAGLGWAAASAPSALGGEPGDAAQPSLPLVLAGAAGLGLVMGVVLGAAQAAALRGAARNARRWVVANALAWPPAMAVIFLGATVPAATWPTAVVVPVGTMTGVTAGVVLGLVSGRFLPEPGNVRGHELVRTGRLRTAGQLKRG